MTRRVGVINICVSARFGLLMLTIDGAHPRLYRTEDGICQREAWDGIPRSQLALSEPTSPISDHRAEGRSPISLRGQSMPQE